MPPPTEVIASIQAMRAQRALQVDQGKSAIQTQVAAKVQLQTANTVSASDAKARATAYIAAKAALRTNALALSTTNRTKKALLESLCAAYAGQV